MKITKRSWIVYSFILVTSQLCAMPQKQQYLLINAIEPQYAKGKITLVKQFSDGTTIIFDDQSRGELFDNSYKHVCSLWGPETSNIYNVYKLLDENKEELIIAQGDDKITLYNLKKRDKDLLHRRCLNLGLQDKFSLLQRPDLSIFVRLYPQNTEPREINICPNWCDAKTGNCKISKHEKPVAVSFCHHEGNVVPAIWYKEDPAVRLSNDIFDMPLIPLPGLSGSITCYHKTRGEILLVSHNNCFIGIWRCNQKN